MTPTQTQTRTRAAHSLPAASPWTRTDAALTVAVMAVGCAVWAVGWYRVSGEGAFDAQIAPMNVAILGVLVAATGQVQWFLSGRRSVDYRRRMLLGDDAAPALIAAPAEDLDSFVGSERLYHRAECPMAQDRAWAPLSRTEQEQAGRVPCGWCEP